MLIVVIIIFILLYLSVIHICIKNFSVTYIFCVITASYNKTTSIDLDTFWRLRVLLARNQTQQDALDRVKLSGVDERVKADVEICDGQHSVQTFLVNRELRMNVETQNVDIHRSPGDGV